MVNERLRRRGGDAAATQFECILFVSIRIASFLRKVNVGSGTSFLLRARACTQLWYHKIYLPTTYDMGFIPSCSKAVGITQCNGVHFSSFLCQKDFALE